MPGYYPHYILITVSPLLAIKVFIPSFLAANTTENTPLLLQPRTEAFPPSLPIQEPPQAPRGRLPPAAGGSPGADRLTWLPAAAELRGHASGQGRHRSLGDAGAPAPEPLTGTVPPAAGARNEGSGGCSGRGAALTVAHAPARR